MSSDVEDEPGLVIVCEGPPICLYDGAGDPALVMPCPWCQVLGPGDEYRSKTERPN